MKNHLRIATRQSPLALWQAEYIKHALSKIHPELTIELLGITTQGDKHLGTPLAKIGGKGLFVKELEQALLDGRADIAVHSMKDVPLTFPEELILAVICQREDPRDVMVSTHYQQMDDLPLGASIGTASLRRQAQLKALRPDLNVSTLRGSVNTRLNRLDSGDFSAIILAAAGLLRLGMQTRISSYLTPEQCLPAVGQGALGIECRKDDQFVLELIKTLDHLETRRCVTAERAMNLALQGGCQIPVAGYAMIHEQQLMIRGRVGVPDGSRILQAMQQGRPEDAEQLGAAVAKNLIDQGAAAIIQQCYSQ